VAEDLGDKTEQPTQKKLADARQKGQVVKSVELMAAFDLALMLAVLWIFGTVITELFTGMLRHALDPLDVARVWSTAEATDAFIRAIYAVLPMTAGILGGLFVITLASGLAQTRGLLSGESITPKIERLNPIAGLQKLFQLRNITKNLLNILKVFGVTAVAVVIVMGTVRTLGYLPAMNAKAAMGVIAELILDVLLWVVIILLVLGFADYAYQYWQFMQDNKMTKQQVKEERKDTDGDPEIKARVARIGRQIAMGQLKRDVPTADVIVTNPTHFAVALKYDGATMASPKVVAKGADFMAFRIRELAIASGVPIVEKPELARALYKAVPVGRTIDSRFFQAVAEILAYVYRLQGKAA
jgi:flagellar biosynthesis protein FlhB